MRHRSMFRRPAIVGLALVLAPVAASAQQKTIKDQLVGSWSKVFSEQTFPDGRKVHYVDVHPRGISTFDIHGRLTVMLGHSDLTNSLSNDHSRLTPEAAVAIAKGIRVYYGSYRVNEVDKVLNFDLEGTSFADELVGSQTRFIAQINDLDLKIRDQRTSVGGQVEVSYKRLK